VPRKPFVLVLVGEHKDFWMRDEMEVFK
jgi:hypothetical protein